MYALALAKSGSKLQKAKGDKKPGVAGGAGRIVYQEMPIATLVNTLANLLGNPVLDQTGIQGCTISRWSGRRAMPRGRRCLRRSRSSLD